jgi:hypothetical protein
MSRVTLRKHARFRSHPFADSISGLNPPSPPLTGSHLLKSHFLQFSGRRFNLDFTSGFSIVQNEKRFDPFKPSQPQIPGVAPIPSEEEGVPSEVPEIAEKTAPGKKGRWIVAAVGCALTIAALFGWWSHAASSSTNNTVSPATAAPTSVSGAVQPAEVLPVGPGEIATTEELSKTWSAKEFLFRNDFTSETFPAMVVRLPAGGYWGFSLREPFGNCDLEYVTDLNRLQTYYNFHADHPMVGDPCDRSVFDLTHYGTAPKGLVRGEIEQGTAIRPPLAIEISTRGDQVLAVRAE